MIIARISDEGACAPRRRLRHLLKIVSDAQSATAQNTRLRRALARHAALRIMRRHKTT